MTEKPETADKISQLAEEFVELIDKSFSIELKLFIMSVGVCPIELVVDNAGKIVTLTDKDGSIVAYHFEFRDETIFSVRPVFDFPKAWIEILRYYPWEGDETCQEL